MKKLLLICCVIFYALSAVYAQNQANIWYFGHYAGLDFNGDSVSVIEGPSSFHNRVQTMCNRQGELLFYLNDRSELYDSEHHLVEEFKVNKQHFIVKSSIVPHPKHPNIYLQFKKKISIINILL